MSLKVREKHLQVLEYRRNSKMEKITWVKGIAACRANMADNSNWAPAQSQEPEQWGHLWTKIEKVCVSCPANGKAAYQQEVNRRLKEDKNPLCVREWGPNLNYLLIKLDTDVKHELKPVKVAGTSGDKRETIPWGCFHNPGSMLKILRM